jgi:enoyl-[acyl-carrier protein] reductase I
MPTRAASGIDQFDQLMEQSIERSPLHKLATPEDVGNLVAFLISDLGQRMTGNLVYVDAGDNIMS